MAGVVAFMYIQTYTYVYMYKYVLARVIWPATFARSAGPPGGQNGRTEIYIYISYVRHFWSRGPRATRKRKPAHLKFKGHMHACCILLYVANASRAITTLIERLHMYSSSLITSSAG